MNMKKFLAAASASVVAISAIAVTSMTSSADISSNIWDGSGWASQSSTTVDAPSYTAVAYWLSGDDLDKFESATVTLSNLGGFGKNNDTAADVYSWGEGQDWATVVQVGDKLYSVYDAVKAGLFNSDITELTISFDKSDLNGGNEIKVSTCQVSATVSLNVKLKGDTTSGDTSSDTSDDTSGDTSGDTSSDTSGDETEKTATEMTIDTSEGITLTVMEGNDGKTIAQVDLEDIYPTGIKKGMTFAELKDKIVTLNPVDIKTISVDGISASDVTVSMFAMMGEGWSWNATSENTWDLSGLKAADTDVLQRFGAQIAIYNSELLAGLKIGDTVVINKPESKPGEEETSTVKLNYNEWNGGNDKNWQGQYNITLPGVTSSSTVSDVVGAVKSLEITLDIVSAVNSEGKEIALDQISGSFLMTTGDPNWNWCTSDATITDGKFTVSVADVSEMLKGAEGNIDKVALNFATNYENSKDTVTLKISNLNIKLNGNDVTDDTNKPGDSTTTPGNSDVNTSGGNTSGGNTSGGNTSGDTNNSGNSAIGTVTFPSSGSSTPSDSSSGNSSSSDDKNTSESTPNASGDSNKPVSNPNTGVALSLLPIAAAAAGVVIFKKKK